MAIAAVGATTAMGDAQAEAPMITPELIMGIAFFVFLAYLATLGARDE